MPFGGNPNRTITAIGGAIVCSRTSGQTPCFVQVSASGITGTGTSTPYTDLEFSWNFGDPSGTEIFTQPLNSALDIYAPNSVNMNSAQTGPEAAYCYRSAGTYTVTLTIRGGPAGAIVAQKTQNITVTAYNASGGTFYFDQNAPGGGNGSISTPWNTVAQINSAMAANVDLKLKRGSDWTGTAGLLISASPMRIGSYGSGARPRIRVSSGETYPLFMWAGGGGSPDSKDDIVFTDLIFGASGTANPGGDPGPVAAISTIGNTTGTLSNVYFDNVDCISEVAGVAPVSFMAYRVEAAYAAATTSKCGIWGGTFSCLNASGSGAGTSIYGGGRTWGFMVGATCSGAGRLPDTGRDHHIYPIIQQHSLYRYLTFEGGLHRNFCINTNYDRVAAVGLEYAEFVCMSDNDFTASARGFDASNGDNEISTARFRNFVAQRNAMHGLTDSGIIFTASAEAMTIRDTLSWGNTGDVGFLPYTSVNTILVASYYRNKNYKVSSGSPGADTSLLNFPGLTQLQEITDNISVDLRVSANLAEITFSAQAGALINRNQYYYPNSAAPFYDDQNAKNYAQWQAAGFDAAGTIADPLWIDPANGNFSTSTPPPPGGSTGGGLTHGKLGIVGIFFEWLKKLRGHKMQIQGA